MKKRYSRILVFVVSVLLIMTVVSASMPVSLDNANNKAKEPLNKITFIHYKDGTVRAIGGSPKLPTCYKIMGVKWNKLPVSYVINPGSYDTTFVSNAISTSAETWDASTSKELFNNKYKLDSSATWDDGTLNPIDYKNEYVFGTYSDNNVIAVTVIWYTRFGKQIVDYDVLFNTYYKWGDVKIDPTVMDLQNIATHETGHAVGLSDLYTQSCSAVTMYGYSTEGETSKRTLEPADITGLQKIYGF
ncbi:MAG: matrixin family metalloprotease [Candidatus Pacearchaeota archaeon]|nr:matrixin family metalloprotease [Candidatus Pacearchaeota archaeon]